ncbi:MAG: hypothetical protein AAFQ89_09650 [Cyanobacteria bacterium J06626_18]
MPYRLMPPTRVVLISGLVGIAAAVGFYFKGSLSNSGLWAIAQEPDPSQVTPTDLMPLPTWFEAGSHPQDYEMGADRRIAYSSDASGTIRARATQTEGFGTLMQIFDAAEYQGQRLRLRGYVKAEAVEEWAGLWMRVDGAGGQILSFDNMQNRSVTGMTPWIQYSVVLDAPVASDRIAFGVLLAGAGRVWCDQFQFATVGLETPVTALTADNQIPAEPSNLDFEQGSNE